MNSRLAALLPLLAFCCIFSACEEIADPDGLPFVERLIVQATVSPNLPLDSIYIRRTVPLTEKYDSVRAIINDVTGRVEVDGQSFPLVYMGESRYAAQGLTPQSGKTYRLYAEWNGKKVTSVTTVPFPPVVDRLVAHEIEGSGQAGDTRYDTVGAVITPRGSEVYAVEVYTRSGRPYDYYSIINLNYYEVIRRGDDTEADGKVHVLYTGYPQSLNPQNTMVAVYSFDRPFYDFYFSYYGRDGGDDFFFGGGQPVYWNVHGDGIGMFIGKTWVYKELN